MTLFYLIAPVLMSIILYDVIRSFNKKDGIYEKKDLLTNISIGIIGFILAGLIKKLLEFIFFIFLFELTLTTRQHLLGYETLGWSWWIWILAVFGDDFTYYWHHRWSHSIRLLWAAHVVHHSSKYFNFSTGLRNGWVVLLYKHFWWIWMPIIGFEPVMITSVLIFNSLYQFAMHIQYNGRYFLPDLIFISPQLHQVHHARDIQYIDKNYGGFLSIWDRFFGTFEKYDATPEFGITKDIHSNNPFYLHAHEFLAIARDVRQSKSFRETLLYIFGVPGWQPDKE